MLSTSYRLKLEFICKRIANGGQVELAEMVWANKLAAVNRAAATMLRQARRKAENPEMQPGGLDDFLNALDIGGVGDEAKGVRGFSSPDEIADYFKREKPDDWRQRD